MSDDPGLNTNRAFRMPKHIRDRTRREWDRLKRAQVKAVAALTECCWPLCDSPPQSRSSPLCPDHALTVWSRYDALNDEPSMTAKQYNRWSRSRSRQQYQDQMRQERESRAMSPGWIYYVQVADRIKIGYTSDVASRIRSYPPEAKLLAVHPGTLALERDMHQQFKGSRAAGREWYYPHQDLLDHIADVVRQFGEPGKRGLSRLAVGVKPESQEV